MDTRLRNRLTHALARSLQQSYACGATLDFDTDNLIFPLRASNTVLTRTMLEDAVLDVIACYNDSPSADIVRLMPPVWNAPPELSPPELLKKLQALETRVVRLEQFHHAITAAVR